MRLDHFKDNDPGIQQCTLTKLSDRLKGIKDRWLNLGDNQRAILDNIIISAECHEEHIENLERELAKHLPQAGRE